MEQGIGKQGESLIAIAQGNALGLEAPPPGPLSLLVASRPIMRGGEVLQFSWGVAPGYCLKTFGLKKHSLILSSGIVYIPNREKPCFCNNSPL